MVFNVHRNTHSPTSGSHSPHPDPQAIIDGSTHTSPPVEIHVHPDNANTNTNTNTNRTNVTQPAPTHTTTHTTAGSYGSGAGAAYGQGTTYGAGVVTGAAAATGATYGSGNTYGSNPSVGASGRPSHATVMGYDGVGQGHEDGFPKTIVTLTPIATPQALGLTAWASALFVFSSYLADWYGSTSTANTIWPFILAFGGLGQFAAGMWAFNARDTLNSALHTMWGCFWLSVGVYFAYETAAAVNIWGRIDAFAIWQVPIGVFTWAACIAALFRDWSLMVILLVNAIGCTLSVIGWFASSTGCLEAAAYFWLASCLGMWYRVTAHFIAETSKKDSLLPVWRRNKPHVGRARNPLEAEACSHQWVAPYREAGVVQGEW